jgi:hypothetical protein
MADILTMKGVTVAAPDEAVSDVVEELENLLAEAKAGHLRAFACATVSKDAKTGTVWAGALGTRYPLGGAILALHHRYGRRLIED